MENDLGDFSFFSLQENEPQFLHKALPLAAQCEEGHENQPEIHRNHGDDGIGLGVFGGQHHRRVPDHGKKKGES